MKLLTIQKKRVLWSLLLGAAVAVTVDFLYGMKAFEALEAKTFDLRAAVVRGDKKGHPDVALILVDEASLRMMNPLVGRWPWPRSIYGDLLEFLSMGGAKAVLFDILFTENEKVNFGSDELGPNDQVLMEATASSGNVYHAAQILVDEEDELNKSLLNKPMPAEFVDRFSLKNFDRSRFEQTKNNNYYLPFPELYEVSKGTGVVEFSPDRDGVYRKTKLFRHYQGNFYPVLSMAYLLDELKPEKIAGDAQSVKLNGMEIPILPEGTYLINMYRHFNTFSIGGILASIQKMHQAVEEGREIEPKELMVRPEEFRDKIVLIGASATGVEDLKPTALDSRTPGVMLHASVIGNVLSGDFLKVVPAHQTRIIIYAGAILLGVLLTAIASPVLQILLPIFCALLYGFLSFQAFESNVVFDLVPPLVSIIAVWICCFSYLYLTEGKDKRKIRKMLGQYVSPAVLTELIEKNEDFIKAEVGSRENLTILFSDVRGFTSLSEGLEAEVVVDILNRYLSRMVDIIFYNNGTLDKFIGDAIMAFWGAPIRISDHGKKAVKAALEMAREMQAINREFAEKGYPVLRIGIGVHTGEVILGNIGSEKKLDYTVIGDHVNLASRLEGLTKPYGCDLLISETTYRELEGLYPCRIVDNVRVKGKEEPIRIYSVMGLSHDPPEQLDLRIKISKYFETAFEHYVNRDFEKALDMYMKVGNYLKNDYVSEMFIERCKTYIKTPPPKEWDGVYTMTSK